MCARRDESNLLIFPSPPPLAPPLDALGTGEPAGGCLRISPTTRQYGQPLYLTALFWPAQLGVSSVRRPFVGPRVSAA